MNWICEDLTVCSTFTYKETPLYVCIVSATFSAFVPVQPEAVRESCLPLASDSVLQRILALPVIHNGHVHLVHRRLEIARDAVLAPPRHPASRSRAIFEFEIEHAVAGGVTGSRDPGA